MPDRHETNAATPEGVALKKTMQVEKVFVVSHDQGVDGGQAVAVFATEAKAVEFVEQQMDRYPDLKRCEGRLVWDSLGDTFLIDEFEVKT